MTEFWSSEVGWGRQNVIRQQKYEMLQKSISSTIFEIELAFVKSLLPIGYRKKCNSIWPLIQHFVLNRSTVITSAAINNSQDCSLITTTTIPKEFGHTTEWIDICRWQCQRCQESRKTRSRLICLVWIRWEKRFRSDFQRRPNLGYFDQISL